MTVIPIGDAPGGAGADPDGSEQIPAVQGGQGVFLTAAQLAAFALSLLGGTDGDGNVYSTSFDSAGRTLYLKVVTATGTTVQVGVSGDGAASLNATDAAGNAMSFSGLPTAAGLVLVDSDSNPVGSLTIGASGVSINGVVVDPTAPWPGG